MTTDQHLLRAITDHTWQVTRAAGLRKTCCIAAGRIAQQVAHYFGISLRPVPTKVMVANEIALPYVTEQVPMSAWPEGAWTVGANGSSRPGHYAGHLIMAADDESLTIIIDPSLPQFGSVRLGVAPTPLVDLVHGPRWPAGPEDGRACFAGSGYVVLYEPFDDRGAFRQAVDWKDWARRYRPLVAQAIRDVRDQRATGEHMTE